MKLNKIIFASIVLPFMIGCTNNTDQKSEQQSQQESSEVIPEHTALDFLESGKMRFDDYQVPYEGHPVYFFYYADGAQNLPLETGTISDLAENKTLSIASNTGCNDDLFVAIAYDLKGEQETKYAVYVDIPTGKFQQLMVEINHYYLKDARKAYVAVSGESVAWNETLSTDMNYGLESATQWNAPQHTN